jgi:Flp pilus assembly protein TadG
MIGSGLMERWVLKIFLRGNAPPAKRGAWAQRSCPCERARRWRGACVRLIDDRSGSVVPTVAIALTVLLGLTALGTEVGTWYGTKRNMQGAADSAAYSAAIAKNAPPGTSSVFTAQAKSVAGSYGYVDASNNVTVTVNNPPKLGNYSTNNFAIEVTIQQPQQASLSATYMKTAPTLAARAVALLTTSSKCVYALNPNVSDSLHVDGGGVISSACGVAVNSSSTSAAIINGTLSAPTVDIVGGYSGTINSPKITTGSKRVSDPLFYLPPPSYLLGSCDYINYSISSGTVSLSKGVYCGGITISGNAAVTLNAGTYILMGGGLTISGTGTVSGTGVTLYNTGNTLYPYKPVQIDNSAVTLTAPTSGVLAGILFFQDRSIVSTAANVLAGSFAGALYFPTTPINLNAGSGVTVPYTILVGDTVSLFVNSLNIKSDYSSLAGGSPIKEAKLVE